MSFESAVAIAQVFGSIAALLWLTLPVTAIAAILRRRRHRPGSSYWLAWSILGVWILSIFLSVLSIVSSGWYGENGPPPQIAALEATVMLLVLVTAHVTLIRTSAIPNDED